MAVKRSFKDMLPPNKAQEPVAAPEPAPAPVQTPVQQEAQQPVQAPQPAAPAAAVETPAAPAVHAPAESGGVAAGSVQAAPPAAPAPAPTSASSSATDVKAEAPAESKDPSGPARPHYTQLLRKELRVFQDQAADLKMLTMHINSLKGGSGERGERITDNTLVRCAIDLLFQRKEELVGSTEAELREALNLPPRY
ncbi:hypothetical protein [Arthrobacter caoxuetaonis]|uniref:Uncharacterized protein n=1 Tax=Arthrobacter caoxuetaonis TaxID=2886935 RepID=A0A9X1SE66_9MICC|nr:hypothetical protein [Arthrobacter caoxuetaonis]MCC3299321.1 hypothetical protein [Arthrobacter caoxuetaonis]USQ59186.1 hypothetical protein NF551_16515 [Arthrobacter caoxuetaonis]